MATKINEPNPAEDEGMSMEVQCRFFTTMPERYQVPDTEINIASNATGKDLTKIVK